MGSSPHTRGALFLARLGWILERIIPAYAGSTSRRAVRGRRCPGSSPHTRGAPPHPSGVFSMSRIIPAYAGSTSGVRRRELWRQDHPRIRGEHGENLAGRAIPRGSSPHTRGAHPAALPGDQSGRIIPAYAGSTLIWRRRNPHRGDHPRIRGEHRRRGAAPCGRRRIIPAYAGSTCRSLRRKPGAWDHPRIRGEHTWESLQYQGSPP